MKMATHEIADLTTLYPTISAKPLLDRDYQVSLRITPRSIIYTNTF